MKMFLTQLNGLFSRVFEKEQFTIEDAARLLAQAIVGDGSIYVIGFNEMEAVSLEIFQGAEPLQHAKPFKNIEELSDSDRVLMVTRFSNDPNAVAFGKKLTESHIPFVCISGFIKHDDDDLQELADVNVNTSLIKAMLPTETGDRIGFPSTMVALFIYHCIKFTLDEIIEEY